MEKRKKSSSEDEDNFEYEQIKKELAFFKKRWELSRNEND
jgi:hypothetical protein